MSDEPQPEPTHLPEEGRIVEPIAYSLGVQFHPSIKLDRRAGLEFAANLAGHIDPEDVKTEASQWVFTQPLGGSGKAMHVFVKKSVIELQATYPTHKQEWFEERYRQVLGRFEEHFHPELMLASKAMVRGLLQINGDARVFLGDRVMGMDPSRLNVMGRPLHLLGLRIFFPPFEEDLEQENAGTEGPHVTDWGVDVKVESWIEDPSKLFLEADASWRVPKHWDDEAVTEAVARLQTVSQYLQHNVFEFLQHKSDDSQPG